MSSKSILNNRRINFKDFALAVTLLCKGYELIKFELLPNSQCVYYFAEDRGIRQLVKEYNEGEVLLEPSQLIYTATWLDGQILEEEPDEN
jgi:hypothetical protein